MVTSERNGRRFLLFASLLWCVLASAPAQEVQLKSDQTPRSYNLFPSGFQVEVSGLVQSMYSELTNLESQLEQVAAERDALYATNVRLEKEVALLKRKNNSRLKTGLLVGAAVSTVITGIICCACLTVALK